MASPQYEYNVALDGQSLELDEGLQTAVILSLLTWRRADSEDPVPDKTDLKGWWGDSFPEVEGDFFGSKLWIVQNMPATEETLQLAKTYAEEALQWMLDDGIVESVDVTDLQVQDRATGLVLAGRIGLKRPGQVAVSWVDMWKATLSG